jgi:tetratricopeptide (TPR) repeat protein
MNFNLPLPKRPVQTLIGLLLVIISISAVAQASLQDKGLEYFKSQDYKKALEYFIPYNAWVEKTYEKYSAEHYNSLNNVAYVQKLLAQNNEARATYVLLLDVVDKLATKNCNEYVNGLANLNEVNSALGNAAEAEEGYKLIVQLRENQVGKDKPEYGFAQNLLGTFYFGSGKYEKAIAAYEAARNVFEASQDANYQVIVDNLGLANKGAAHYADALKYFRQSLSLKEKFVGKETASYAETQNEITLALASLAKYDEALISAQEVVQIRSRVLGEKHNDFATAVNNVGYIYFLSGRYEEAKPYYEKATRLWGESAGKQGAMYAAGLVNLGLICEKLNELDKSEAYYNEALPLLEKATGTENYFYSTTLNNLGALKLKQGYKVKAEPLFRQCLAIQKKILGETHPDYGTVIGNLAALYETLGLYDKALSLGMESLTIQEKTLGKEHPSYARTLSNLAAVYSAMGKNVEAETSAKEAVAIRLKALGKTNPEYANSMSNLAHIYRVNGKNELADATFKEVLKLLKDNGMENSPVYASCMNNLASFYSEIGKDDLAEQSYKESMKLREKLYGKQSEEYAKSLNNIATFYNDKGQQQKAVALLRESLAISEKVVGKEHPTYISAVINLGRLYYDDESYALAEPLLVQALNSFEKSNGTTQEGYYLTLQHMGDLYSSLGKYDKAHTNYQQALKIIEATLGTSHNAYIRALRGVAGLYLEQEKYVEAQELLTKCVDLVGKSVGKEHRDYVHALSQLGSALKDSGQPSKSIPFFKEALQIQERILGKGNLNYAMALGKLADAYSEMHFYAEALPLFEEALKITEKVVGKNHPAYITELNNFSGLYKVMGQYAKAEALLLPSVKGKLEELEKNTAYMSESEKRSFKEKNQTQFNNFTFLAIDRSGNSPNTVVPAAEQSQKIIGELYDMTIKSKGWLLGNSSKIRQRIMGSGNQQLIAKFEKWEALKNKIAQAGNSGTEVNTNAEINIDALQAESNQLEKEISLASEEYKKSMTAKPVSWNNIRERLLPGEAAIEIIRTNYFGHDTLYLALIVTHETKDNPLMVVLKNGLELEKRYFNFYKNSIKNQSADKLSYDQYWKPIAAKLPDIKKIYFSADGVYNQLSLNAIQNPATQKFIGEEMDIHQVTSTKDILSFRAESRKRTKGTAVMLGNPTYNMLSGDAKNVKQTQGKEDRGFEGFADMTVPPLPGTQEEVSQIDKILLSQNWQTKVFTKELATEANAKRVSNPNILHIATHGFFIQDQSGATEPMMRSGLILAGAVSYFRSVEKPEGDDGILTAYELTNLSLDSTEVVALSACETGLGEVASGEGVYGLQRALKVAGAKTILISMWTVNDQATQELMSLFYQNWFATGNKREAFKNAQASLRAKYSTPYFWAGFVMIGE